MAGKEEQNSTFKYIVKWLPIIEAEAEQMLEISHNGEGDIYKDKAAELATKYITLILRLLDLYLQHEQDEQKVSEVQQALLSFLFHGKAEAPDSV